MISGAAAFESGVRPRGVAHPRFEVKSADLREQSGELGGLVFEDGGPGGGGRGGGVSRSAGGMQMLRRRLAELWKQHGEPEVIRNYVVA